MLFNWLLARKTGGTFILRIEDTDRARHVEDSVAKILEDLRWLGLTWDEGPEAGGDFGPYFQSERRAIYDRYLQQLLESGDAYYALDTPEELSAMREAAQREKRGFRYPRPDPVPTMEQGEAARAEGRSAVVRFKMPQREVTVVDDILQEVTLPVDQLDDFVIQKSDGYPTYHFACVVDDELMKVSHVLRGQEHLNNTPKHVALQHALGFATPRYAHLPVIFNMNGGKMSKRDKEKAVKKGLPPPEIDVHDFRRAGYLPEAVLNFISLLGWSPGEDREQFTLEETISLFGIERVGKTNARFDRGKLLSFNTDWAARVTPERLLEAFKDYAVVSESPMRHADDATLVNILRACAGFRTFPDIEKKAGFLFVADDAIEYDAKAVKKVLAKGEGRGFAMLETLAPKLQGVSDWSSASIEVLVNAVCAEREAKLGDVAQPIRVAVTGSTISPAIGETLELLGKEAALTRIARCLALRGDK